MPQNEPKVTHKVVILNGRGLMLKIKKDKKKTLQQKKFTFRKE